MSDNGSNPEQQKQTHETHKPREPQPARAPRPSPAQRRPEQDEGGMNPDQRGPAQPEEHKDHPTPGD